MSSEEAKEFLISISYQLGNIGLEYLSEKDGEKMHEAIKALERKPFIVIDGHTYVAKQPKLKTIHGKTGEVVIGGFWEVFDD